MNDVDTANAAISGLEKQLPSVAEALRVVPGVLSVRPGFRVRSGVLMDEPVIVVKVRRKSDSLGKLIHERFPDLPIDIAPAAPYELLGTADVEIPGAAPWIEAAPWQTPQFEPEASGVNHYDLPDHLELSEFEEKMTVQCHVSPDAGWPTLKPFLADADGSITLAMYEFFGAKHVTDAFVLAGQAVDDVAMIVDPTSKSAGVVDASRNAIGDHCIQEWASVARNGSIFATSYHTKVLVLGRSRFWLSSGNWKSSGQPDIDPVNEPSDRVKARTRNREWHIIVRNDALAALLEDYIRYDIEQVQQLAEVEIVAQPGMPDLFVPVAATPEAGPIPPKFFPAMAPVTDVLRIQPLLTPDNYIDHIIPLLASATISIDIQHQYFSIQKVSGGNLIAILNELKKQRDAGVRIRMILRDKDFPNGEVEIRKMCEALRAHGFEMGKHIKLQHNCHNKGIIVDSKTVVVGSHNWSGDGVTNNRDASLIIHDRPDIADYYGRVFLLDWGLGNEVIPEQLDMPEIATTEIAPPGTVRMKWNDYYEG